MDSERFVRKERFCSLCGNAYDNEKYIRKILHCGHSVCLSCFSEETKEHPESIESVKESVSDFLTNPAVTEIPKSESLEGSELSFLIENMIIEDWMDLKKYPMLENLEGTSVSVKKMTNVLPSCFEQDIIKANFTLKSFPDKEQFLDKIVAELIKENEIYAFYSVPFTRDVLFSRLSYDKERLYINSLSSDMPTRTSLFVTFTDLKNCFDFNHFQTFIDIPGNHIVCNLTGPSLLSYDFLKLCSGEGGSSFKNLPYEIKHVPEKQQDIISLKLKELNEIDLSYIYSHPLPSEAKEPFEDRLHIKMWRDKCEIIKNPETPSSEESESDGIVVASATHSASEFLNLSFEGERRVEDCGLILLFS